jgi:curved DNA-binding protein
MEFKDYYAALGVERSATQEEVKHAYRRMARKFHPDLNKAPDAEARFKEIGEAYKVLGDPEKRAAYDDVGQRYGGGQEFQPPPGWEGGFEFSGRNFDGEDAADLSEFFRTLFGGRGAAGPGTARGQRAAPGRDHHAKVVIDLADAYRGARRSLGLRFPTHDEGGRVQFQERQLEVEIPRGVRAGQHLRLSGQGEPGTGGAPAGDLYLEVAFREQAQFRVDGRDVYLDLPIAPWEAALGAAVVVPYPAGSVEAQVPPGSGTGRKLRFKGLGIPGDPPGDLYAVLQIAAPPAGTPEQKDAYSALARQFAGYDPRKVWEA